MATTATITAPAVGTIAHPLPATTNTPGTGRRFAIGFGRDPAGTPNVRAWAVVADDGRVATGGDSNMCDAARVLELVAQLIDWNVDVTSDIIITNQASLPFVRKMSRAVRDTVHHYAASRLTAARYYWESYLFAIIAPVTDDDGALAYIAGHVPDRDSFTTMTPSRVLEAMRKRSASITTAAGPDIEPFVGRRVATDASVTADRVAIAWATPWETHAERIDQSHGVLDPNIAEEIAVLAAFDTFRNDAVVEVLTDSQIVAKHLTQIIDSDDMFEVADPRDRGHVTTEQLHQLELTRWRIGVGQEGVISRRVIWMPRCSNELLRRADSAARACRISDSTVAASTVAASTVAVGANVGAYTN